jgi:NAD(P)H-nitrite reductase large subunit
MQEQEIFICRCEEVTEAEVLEAIERGACDIDGVKRLTRAGMGLCQGKSCSHLIRDILHRELGIAKEELEPCTTRPPVRLIPSRAFTKAEQEIMAQAEEVKKMHGN